MTTDIERQFFDTFGIEKIIPCYKCNMQNTNWDCKRTCLYDDEKRKEYPVISDRILLELICIDFNENPYKCRGGQTSVDEVKERILSDFIHEFENDLYLDKENIKHQVQSLFKEG